MSDDEVRTRIILNAITLIEAWCSDFGGYEELAPLVRAIRSYLDNQVDEDTGLPIRTVDTFDTETYEISDEDITSALSEIDQEYRRQENNDQVAPAEEFPERQKPKTEVYEEDDDGIIQLFKKPKRKAPTPEVDDDDVEVYIEVDKETDEE
jgi:hypothetical protein